MSRINAAIDHLKNEIAAELGASVLTALEQKLTFGPPRDGRVINLAERRKAWPIRGIAKGQKRPPEDIAALTDQLHAYVAKHPGLRIEKIAAGMGVTTRELNLPVKKLLAGGRIAAKGWKRATTYKAAGRQ